MYENRKKKKPSLISKFMTSQIGKQIFTIHQYLKKYRQSDKEIKSIFYHFSRVFFEANETNLFGGRESDFKCL